MTGRQIAICGLATSSMHDAPAVGTTNWEVWQLAWSHIPADRLFEPHVLSEIDRYDAHLEGRLRGQYREGLRGLDMPIYMKEAYPEFPSAVRYPIEDVITTIGVDYFTSSIAYMAALAIHEHRIGRAVRKIGIWGVDLCADGEYQYQRPCVEYLIGLARGMGIQVFVPKNSTLLTSPGGRYGCLDWAGPVVRAPGGGLPEPALVRELCAPSEGSDQDRSLRLVANSGMFDAAAGLAG